MTARKNYSRGKELDIVKYAFQSDLNRLKSFLLKNTNGGEYKYGTIKFVFGKLERLLPDINWDEVPSNCGFNNIKTIYHLDGINKKRKLNLEKEFNLESKILTNKSKADLLVVNDDGPSVVSYKDEKKIAKLGQVSAQVQYNGAVLKGGLILPIPLSGKNQILFSDTDLSKNQFDKISLKDKNLAYFKKHKNKVWNEYVRESLNNANSQLKKFGNALEKDNKTFIQFVSQTLFGTAYIPTNYQILIGSHIIYTNPLIEFFCKKKYYVSCEDYKTEKKYSLLIYLEIENKKYCITKIEPSFEGAPSNVSQTKGIIFHFQQFPLKGFHIWQFLKDISENII